jgi:hypothetical protein
LFGTSLAMVEALMIASMVQHQPWADPCTLSGFSQPCHSLSWPSPTNTLFRKTPSIRSEYCHTSGRGLTLHPCVSTPQLKQQLFTAGFEALH